MPLLLTQDDAVHECLAAERGDSSSGVPLGAKVIRAVRAIDALTSGENGPKARPEQAIQELRKDISGGFDPEVLDAMERTIRRTNRPAPAAPAYA
jgi:response regulator RpfG family c-di-GMP phosphodiesterase